jgi:sensor histidine kinase YesM
MIAAYLAIMRTRLAARLSFHIDIGDAFRAIPCRPGCSSRWWRTR